MQNRELSFLEDCSKQTKKRQEELASRFCEGNEDLKNTLLVLWRNEIDTVGCCAGHLLKDGTKTPLYLNFETKNFKKDNFKKLMYVFNKYKDAVHIDISAKCFENNAVNKYVKSKERTDINVIIFDETKQKEILSAIRDVIEGKELFSEQIKEEKFSKNHLNFVNDGWNLIQQNILDLKVDDEMMCEDLRQIFEFKLSMNVKKGQTMHVTIKGARTCELENCAGGKITAYMYGYYDKYQLTNDEADKGLYYIPYGNKTITKDQAVKQGYVDPLCVKKEYDNLKNMSYSSKKYKAIIESLKERSLTI